MAHHTDREEHSKTLSRINAAPISIVSSTDTSNKMEPSFVSEKC
jgi:hypothetical protein